MIGQKNLVYYSREIQYKTCCKIGIKAKNVTANALSTLDRVDINNPIKPNLLSLVAKNIFL